MFKNILKAVFAVTVILASNPASAIECADPKAFVESVRDSVLAVIKSPASDTEKQTQLDKAFRDTADTEWMSKFVLGRNYSKLTPEQQAEYSKVYTDFLSASYVQRFREYNGDVITVNSVKPNNEDFNVDTTINRPGKAAINVNYRVHKSGNCFKVIDVVAEGVSLISTQRQDFTAAFGQRGYDGLIEVLKTKTAQFNSGQGDK